MAEIVSLFACLHPLLSATTIAQFSRIGCTLLAMTGRVTMLNISRWTEKPEPIVYDKMASHLGSIGSIHCPRDKNAPR